MFNIRRVFIYKFILTNKLIESIYISTGNSINEGIVIGQQYSIVSLLV